MIDLVLKVGDITKEDTDVIVNAANNLLLGGGGVDGAIHRSAGHELVKECYNFPVVGKSIDGGDIRCPDGEVKITKGYRLPSRYVIHTVGPRVSGTIPTEEQSETLYNCWKKSLVMADSYRLRSIAFPSISTGAYNFPIDHAAKIAIKAINEFEKENESRHLKEIRIVCFSDEDYNHYQSAIYGTEVKTSKENNEIKFNPYNLFPNIIKKWFKK